MVKSIRRWCFFVNLHEKENATMNQKEAVIEALKKLGGRAHLSDIYKFAYPLADWSGSQNWQNTLRWYLQKGTDTFRSPKRGWWELISYQEELATLKKENEELKERNKVLMTIPKEAEFIEKFLAEVMNEYKRKRPDADPIRNILRHMGHEEAAAVLDAWIDEKEDELAKALLKLAEKPTYKYERGAIHLDKKQEMQLDEDKDNKKKKLDHKGHE